MEPIPSPDRMIATAPAIGREFDRIATLETAAGHCLSPAERWLLARAPTGPGLAVDLGAGTCSFALALAARGLKVVALDRSAGMLAAARRREQTLIMIRADVRQLPIHPAACRCVASIAVLHHLPDPTSALRGWSELVAPGGALLVQDILDRRGVRGLVVNVLALLLAAPARMRDFLSPRRRALRMAYAAHGAGERYLTIAEARRLASEAQLAGAEVREHLGWRYSLVWRRPSHE